MCIDNKPSYQAKLVSLYLSSFLRDKWDNYIKEIQDLDLTSSNVTTLLGNVDKNINDMTNYIEHSKQKKSYDWYVLESTNR